MGYIVRDSGIRIPASTVSPVLTQLTQTSDIACNDTFIAAQGAFATATGTHQIGGAVRACIAAPTNGGATENGFMACRGTPASNVIAVWLGQANGLPNSGQIGLGSTGGPGNGGTFILGNSGLLTCNGASVGFRASVGNVTICDFLAASMNCNKPVQGGNTGVPFQWGQSAVTLGATGSTALTGAQQQTPLLVMSSVTLTGAITLDFGAIIGSFVVDFSQVTIAAQTVTLKNGAGTVSATAILATKNLLVVSCRTAALVNVG